jgi:hypothetical protein
MLIIDFARQATKPLGLPSQKVCASSVNDRMSSNSVISSVN